MKFPQKVTLTSSELITAATVGVHRNVSSLEKNHDPEKYGKENRTDWQMDIEGACYEQALAKCLNVYWPASVDTFTAVGDVAGMDVRGTELKNGCLVFRPKDIEHQERAFWLVTGLAPDYTVHGWIVGSDCQKDEFINAPNNRPPAWFVPQDMLKTDDGWKDYMNIAPDEQTTGGWDDLQLDLEME